MYQRRQRVIGWPGGVSLSKTPTRSAPSTNLYIRHLALTGHMYRGPSTQRLSFVLAVPFLAMATLARIYQSSFDRAPAQTLMFTNGCLSALGDVCAQSIELFSSRDLERKNYDPARTIRFIAFGVGMGPLIGRWNKFLEHAFPLRSAGGKVSFTSLAKRVAADQTMMAPVGMAIFVSSMGFMEGKNVTQVTQKYKDMFVPAMVANWKVWPAVQMINFRFMPLPYRVPFQSTCGVFWTVYLSLLNSQAKER